MMRRTRRIIQRSVSVLAVLSLALIGMIASSPSVRAATGDMLPPFNVGQTWYICQGYSNSAVTHTGTSEYGLDLTTAPSCGAGAAGKNVVAPLSGTISYWSSNSGTLCINVAGNRSVALTHINASVTSGAVSAGDVVGTVAAAALSTPPFNGGVEHIHFQIWGAVGCYNSSTIPFDAVNGARICGAPDLTATSTGGPYANGIWSGVSFTGDVCGATDSDNDGTANTTDVLPSVPGPSNNRGAPIQPSKLSGDFDGDGSQDLAVFYDEGSWRTTISVFKGNGSGGFAWPSVMWNSGIGNYDWKWIKPVTGDFNGDSKDDIAVLYDVGSSRTQVFLFKGTTASTFAWPTVVWDSGVNVWDWKLTMPVVGDFNTDGKDDIAVLYDGGSSRTLIYTLLGTTASTWSWPGTPWDSGIGNMAWGPSRPVTGDFNGDGKDDIAVLYEYGSNWTKIFLFTSTGSGFNWPSHAWDSGVNVLDWKPINPVAGDFNGDGKDDITMLYSVGSNWTKFYTFYGYPAGSPVPVFAWPTQTWDSGAGNLDWNTSKPIAGDFNNDGKTDITIVKEWGVWHTKILRFDSSGTAFSWPTSVFDSGAGNWDWGPIRTS